MSNADKETQLRSLIGELTKADTSTLEVDDDLLEVLDLDSLEALRLLAAVEKRFALRIPDEQLAEMRTFGRLLITVEQAAKQGCLS